MCVCVCAYARACMCGRTRAHLWCSLQCSVCMAVLVRVCVCALLRCQLHCLQSVSCPSRSCSKLRAMEAFRPSASCNATCALKININESFWSVQCGAVSNAYVSITSCDVETRTPPARAHSERCCAELRCKHSKTCKKQVLRKRSSALPPSLLLARRDTVLRGTWAKVEVSHCQKKNI